jgi:hypothetical protein
MSDNETVFPFRIKNKKCPAEAVGIFFAFAG